MTQTEHPTGRITDSSVSADLLMDATGLVLNQAQLMAEQLQSALTVQATIDQAIGILISRGGGTAEEVIATLRAISSSRNTELDAVAPLIVKGAVRRARPGQSEP